MKEKLFIEALERFDNQAVIDDTAYYGLKDLYEALKPLSAEEQRAVNDAVKTKNPDLVNAAMSNVMATRDPALKNRMAQVTKKAVPSASIEETLDAIYEEERILEGRHNLKPMRCTAIKSKKPYWSPYDTKEKEFAQYGTRFRYDTKQSCLDAIADPDNDLGYDKDYGKSSKKDNKESEDSDKAANYNIEEALITEATSKTGNFTVTLYYDRIAHKLRARSNDGEHGNANCSFPNDLRDPNKGAQAGDTFTVSKLGWNGKNYLVNKNDIIQSSFEDNEATKKESGFSIDQNGFVTVPATYFESLSKINEANTDSDDIFEFNGARIATNSISPETLAMIKRPERANGSLLEEAKLLVKLYEFCIVNGQSAVRREDLLKACGVAKYDRAGQSSTFFNDFKRLDLAVLVNNYVKPGKNLRAWVEGAISMDGNPNGIDLRRHVGENYPLRQEQGIMPDRSHKGRSTTTETGIGEKKAAGWIFNDDGSVTIPLSYFENTDTVDDINTEEPIKEALNMNHAVNNSYIEDMHNRIIKQFKKSAYLQEDADIPLEYKDSALFDNWINAICCKCGWSRNRVLKALENYFDTKYKRM